MTDNRQKIAKVINVSYLYLINLEQRVIIYLRNTCIFFFKNFFSSFAEANVHLEPHDYQINNVVYSVIQCTCI